MMTDYRDIPKQVVDEVNSILAFNSSLTVLGKFPDGDRFARGLGPVSLGNKVVIFTIFICSLVGPLLRMVLVHRWRV
jgi:hypothetical protein